MNTRLAKIHVTAILLVLLLGACRSAAGGPEEAYWGYYDACASNQFQTAEEFLHEDAAVQIPAVGVCGFTHDAINRYEAARGGTERTFSEDPVLDSDDNNAALSWIDDQGNLAIVQLVNTSDGWKVFQATWSD